ncbi:unnamed protein product [Meloidogyne enterolobii]|uniref:Uncharacterized protein n=1 Tax=Meloidogyne enterolobii TaxID=390850 RepID=A0ACB0YIA6_MELEN
MLINVHNKILKNYVKNEIERQKVEKEKREKAEFEKEWRRRFIKILKKLKKKIFLFR